MVLHFRKVVKFSPIYVLFGFLLFLFHAYLIRFIFSLLYVLKIYRYREIKILLSFNVLFA